MTRLLVAELAIVDDAAHRRAGIRRDHDLWAGRQALGQHTCFRADDAGVAHQVGASLLGQSQRLLQLHHAQRRLVGPGANEADLSGAECAHPQAGVSGREVIKQ